MDFGKKIKKVKWDSAAQGTSYVTGQYAKGVTRADSADSCLRRIFSIMFFHLLSVSYFYKLLVLKFFAHYSTWKCKKLLHPFCENHKEEMRRK